MIDWFYLPPLEKNYSGITIKNISNVQLFRIYKILNKKELLSIRIYIIKRNVINIKYVH